MGALVLAFVVIVAACSLAAFVEPALEKHAPKCRTGCRLCRWSRILE